MDSKNQHLLKLLKNNAREAISSLAKKLNLSRTAVHERIRKLEKEGIIQAYTVKVSSDYQRHTIGAHVMIDIAPQSNTHVVNSLKNMIEIQALYSVSGAFDLLAVISAETTADVDALLDQIGEIEGVEKTQSSIVLSTKFER